jgi:hypothetical protein
MRRIWNFISRMFLSFAGGVGPVQRTFCYCKNCRHELCGDEDTKVYDGGSEVRFICAKCNWQTDFLFDAPVPIFLRALSPDGKVIER